MLATAPSRVHAPAFYSRGLARAAKSDLHGAISDISAALRYDRKHAFRFQARGELYMKKNEFGPAVADFTAAIRLDPTRAFRFHARALAYSGLGDLDQAILDFSEAIRIDPMQRSFRFHDRGNAFRAAGQYARAFSDYDLALSLEPTNAAAMVDRGRAYVALGDGPRAKADFEAALQLAPDDTEMRSTVSRELSAVAEASPPATGTIERVPVGPQRQESGQPRGTALEEAKRRVEQAEERAASELRLRLEAERREAQLRAELGRRAEGVAPAASTPAQSRGMPADERALIAAAEKGRAAFETGANEMAKGAARPARARDICATFASSLRAVNWIGKVASLSSNGEGKGVLAVEISPGVHIKTFNNSFSDMSSNTLIQPGTGLHAKAVALSPGQQVVFSGTFFRSETDCINEVSLTIRASTEKPEFILRFSDVEPAAAGT